MVTSRARRLELEQLRATQPTRRRGRLPKTPPPRSLVPFERDYRNRIFGLINPAFDIVQALVIPELDALRQSARAEGLHIDATGDDVSRIFAGIRIRFADFFDDQRINRNIDDVSRRVNQANQATLVRQFQTVIGIDPTQAEPWLEPLLELHANQNASLIKTLPNEALPDLEQIVLRGTQAGDSASSIAKELRERWDITEGRARVIARDQVSKLGASLNRQRQQRAGVERYRWKDSDDVKVRKTHERRDGEIFEWGKPIGPQLTAKGLKVDTIDGHPGEPINCRCQPIPVFDRMM